MGSDSETEKSLKEKKKLMALAPIAKPLAGKKLCKKTLKLVRKASESKCLKRGVKEVVKSIRRGHKGLCVIAGNISPIDVITHVPILCEESEIPYIYVPSKEDLATAGATKRPTCCVLVLPKPIKGELGQEEQEKLEEDYNKVASDLKELASSPFLKEYNSTAVCYGCSCFGLCTFMILSLKGIRVIFIPGVGCSKDYQT